MLDGPATFPGDGRLAERMVTNLIDNAIRHNHAGGRVTVRTSAAAGQALLSVVNSGPRIDPADLPGLFEPFLRRRAQPRVSSATADDGLGLGLSIVAAIASAHHARLNVWPNTGGGFVVQAHFACATEAQASLGRQARQPGSSSQPIFVLK